MFPLLNSAVSRCSTPFSTHDFLSWQKKGETASIDAVDKDWYCEAVKNITVSLDDDLYRRARMIAAERDTSVSALVKDFLSSLGAGESEVERLKREEREIRGRITTFRASDKISRDELHDRRL
jgi:hypothetical protein